MARIDKRPKRQGIKPNLNGLLAARLNSLRKNSYLLNPRTSAAKAELETKGPNVALKRCSTQNPASLRVFLQSLKSTQNY